MVCCLFFSLENAQETEGKVGQKGVRAAMGEQVETQKGNEWLVSSLVAFDGKKVTIAWDDETTAEVNQGLLK